MRVFSRVLNNLPLAIFDRLRLNSDKTQFIWVDSRQQVANVTVTEILLDGHSITTSHNVSCLGVVTSRCFYQLRQLWSVRPTLSTNNARMLAHAFIASRVDYCNSILYQTAVVHLRPLQLVLNAAVCLIVKKRKWDSITPTIRDNLHRLLVRQRVEFKICTSC